MSEKRSFTLDAMRGITALAVVTSHSGQIMPPERVVFSYLAVDFFFMLSGFVLARAYEPKLKTSLSAFRFMELRVIRLYPMFALGLLLGALNVAGQIALHSAHAPTPAHASLTLGLGLLMLPDIFSQDYLFSLNGPSWTVFVEMIVNTAFALFLFRLRSGLLAAISLACAAFYFWNQADLGTGNIGWSWSTIAVGIARSGFAFPAGIILGRAFGKTAPRPSLLAFLPIVLLVWILFLGPPARFEFIFDAAAIFILLPSVIWLGASLQAPRALRRLCEIMADISYPLFAIHWPLLRMARYFLIRQGYSPGSIIVDVCIFLLIILAWFIFQYADVPLRRWLSAKSKLRPTAMPVASGT